MARSVLSGFVRDRAGNTVANATVTVYLAGTSTLVSDMYAGSAGGSPITSFVSTGAGYYEKWFDTPKLVKLVVSDTSDMAYYVGAPSTLLSFTAFTVDNVPVYENPADGETDDATLATAVTNIATVTAGLAAHLADTSDAHDASAVSYGGGTGMSATDVEAAIDELATEKANDATAAHLAGIETFTGAKTFNALSTLVAGAQVGSNANSLQLIDSVGAAGTSGRMVTVIPAASAGAGGSAIAVVPADACPSGGITTQILLYNVSGNNYERFGFTCFNGGYYIDSSKLGSGTLRPIVFNMQSTTAFTLRTDARCVVSTRLGIGTGDSTGDAAPTVELQIKNLSATPEIRMSAATTGDCKIAFHKNDVERGYIAAEYAGGAHCLAVDSDGEVSLRGGNVERAKVLDSNPGTDLTALSLQTNNGGSTSVRQVRVGAADSGGAGFRQLIVAN